MEINHISNFTNQSTIYIGYCYSTTLASYLISPAVNRHLVSNIVLAIINIVLAVCGSLSNTFVILTYWTDPCLKRLSNMLIIALAFSDLIVTAIIQPLFIVRKGYFEIYGQHNCILYIILRLAMQFCGGISLITATLVNTERYIAIIWPYMYPHWINHERLKELLAISWLVYFIFIFLRLWVVSVHVLMVVNAVMCVIFLVSTVVMWTHIHMVIRRQKKAIQRQQAGINGQEQRTINNESKAGYLAYVIILCICVCYTPAAMILTYASLQSEFNFQLYYIVMPWAETLVFFNSFANSAIFSWREKKFRRLALKHILCRWRIKVSNIRSNQVAVAPMNDLQPKLDNVEITEQVSQPKFNNVEVTEQVYMSDNS